MARRCIFRTDSDVVRSFGSISHTLTLTRFDPRNGRLLESNEDHLSRLRKIKLSNQKPFHTLWFVSNCDHTWGAIERWKLGQVLINAGNEFEFRLINTYAICVAKSWVHKTYCRLVSKLKKGLKLQGEGKCFNKPSDQDFSSFLYGKPSQTSHLKMLFIVQDRDFL